MRSRLLAVVTATLAAALAAMFVLTVGSPARAAAGFTVANGRLYDANGTEFVMRGISHAHTWYTAQTRAFADIKATGANTVRVVLSGGRWPANGPADVANVVNLCRQNRLICVLENHDTTGYGEQSGAVTLDAAVNYWISVQSALQGQENYVILNIGNEPVGNNNAAQWTQATTSAIARLRNAGFDHAIMVDAPNWGQDWQFVMRDNAQAVFTSDPDRNIIFSIHMYGVFDTAAEITDYLGRFRTAGLPIVVGEFGHNHSDGNPDEDTIMSYTVANGIGYIGWSWSGNGGGVEYLDMVTNFNPSQLTSWGQRIFNGANGIRSTAREATIYGGGGGGGGGGDTTPPTTPGTPTASNVTASGLTLAWTAATDSGGSGLAGYTVVRVQGTTETTVASPTTTSAAVTGLSANTAYTFAVYARDGAGNRSTRSGTVNVTTSSGGGTTAGCAVTYRIVGQWQGGFQGDVVVRNTGSSTISNWTLRWSFANGQTISQMWGGTPARSGAEVTVTPVDWTRTIPANGSIQFGFIGGWTGTNAVPTGFTLNNSACTTG
jgi:mannan endo-1,4-beta-mannosidase